MDRDKAMRIGEYRQGEPADSHGPGQLYQATQTKTEAAALLLCLTKADVSPTKWTALCERLPTLLSLEHPGLLPYEPWPENPKHADMTGRAAPLDELWFPSLLPPMPRRDLPTRLVDLLGIQSPGRLNETNALDAHRQLSGALASLHNTGLYHGAICPELVYLDWAHRPPRLKLAMPGLCFSAQTKVPTKSTPYQPPPQPDGAQEAGQARDRYAVAAVLWWMITGALPPQEPPFTTSTETPWEWPLSHRQPSQALLDAWRPLALSGNLRSSRTLSGGADIAQTLPFGPDAPENTPPSAAQQWSMEDAKTLPYDIDLQGAMAALETRLSATTPTPPSHNLPVVVPDAIPEAWEREALRIDARLDRRKGAIQGLIPPLLWLLLVLLITWLWRANCQT